MLTQRFVAKCRTVSSLVLLVLTVAPTISAAYCIGWDKSLPNYDSQYYSPSHEFKRSRYVIEGQVNREVWLGDDGKEQPLRPPFQYGGRRPWGFDPYMGAFYEIKATKPLKGDPPPVLRLFSENSTARFWLDTGQKYLMFVSEGKFDQPIGNSLTIDTCGNSGKLAQSSAVLRDLQILLHPDP